MTGQSTHFLRQIRITVPTQPLDIFGSHVHGRPLVDIVQQMEHDLAQLMSRTTEVEEAVLNQQRRAPSDAAPPVPLSLDRSSVRAVRAMRGTARRGFCAPHVALLISSSIHPIPGLFLSSPPTGSAAPRPHSAGHLVLVGLAALCLFSFSSAAWPPAKRCGSQDAGAALMLWHGRSPLMLLPPPLRRHWALIVTFT